MSFLATSSFQSQVSAPPEALKQLFEAGKVLERQMGRDSKYPDLADLLMCNSCSNSLKTSNACTALSHTHSFNYLHYEKHQLLENTSNLWEPLNSHL
jgi:hypothetical protein